MSLSKQEILKETGYDSIEDYINAKTDSSKQVNKLFIGKKPGVIEMSSDECKKMCEKANIEYMSGYEGRILSMLTTNEAQDRYGDVVVAKGAKLDSYRKNPVIQFAHDYKMPPVGASIKIWIDKKLKGVPAYGLFMDERVDDSGRSATIFKMAKNGFMKASSIGFNPIKYERPTSSEEAEKMGLGKYGVKFTEWDYLEWSIVPVPANPEALQNMFKSFTTKEISKDFGEEDIEVMEKFKFFENEEAIQIFKDMLKGKSVNKSNSGVSLPDFSFEIKDSDIPENEEGENTVSLSSPENRSTPDIYINLGEAMKNLGAIENEMKTFNQNINKILDKFETILNMSNPASGEQDKNVNKESEDEDSGLYKDLFETELNSLEL